MFVDPPSFNPSNPVLDVVGSGKPLTRLGQGRYEIGHWSFDALLSKGGGNLHEEDDWDSYPDLGDDLGCYGVCDSPEQFMEDHGEKIASSQDEFVMSFTEVSKADQPADGGWRWHKGGEYVGRLKPIMEYLHDEPNIEKVYCYHIFKKKVRA